MSPPATAAAPAPTAAATPAPAVDPPRFADVVDTVETLSDEDQEALIDLLRRRLALRGRERILREVAEGRAEYEAGLLRPMTVEEIMSEAAE